MSTNLNDFSETTKFSLRISSISEQLISAIGCRLIGKNKTKSDFVNNAINFYLWVNLMTLPKDIQKQITGSIVDEFGEIHKFDFNDLIKFFEHSF